MRHPHFLLFLILLFTLTGFAYAEMYRYVDDNGQTRWTDDFSQVPVEQREKAQRYESVKNTDDPPNPALDQQTRDEIVDMEKVGGSDTFGDISRDSLEKEKVDLDNQYQYLLNERQTIEKLTTEKMDEKSREEVNLKITDYNEKTEQYEKQLNRFNDKVNTYNQQLQTKPSNSN